MTGDGGDRRIASLTDHSGSTRGIEVRFDPGAERLQKATALRQRDGMTGDQRDLVERGVAYAEQRMHHWNVDGLAECQAIGEVIEGIERALNRTDHQVLDRQHGTIGIAMSHGGEHRREALTGHRRHIVAPEGANRVFAEGAGHTLIGDAWAGGGHARMYIGRRRH